MRKSIFRGTDGDAIELFSKSPYVHLAGVGVDGAPILRVVHAVVVGSDLCFHSADAGEKTQLLELDQRVVAMTEQIVAEIPSYFIDPERACPATTYYRSAQVHGRLCRVEDPQQKTTVMQALMQRYQPEGGHAEIVAEDPRYAAAVRSLLIARIDLTGAVAKTKLGQNRSAADLLAAIDGLWRRGGRGDARAVEQLRAANAKVPTPDFLQAPGSAILRCALGPGDAQAAAALLYGSYWNIGVSLETLTRVQRAATAWVGAHVDGDLVATARAVSDGLSHAWVADVIVAPAHRGKGIGHALMRLLLEHPAVRGSRQVSLRTRDAQRLYGRLGFEPAPEGQGLTTMLRTKSPSGQPHQVGRDCHIA